MTHVYEPDERRWTQGREARLLEEFGSWFNMPNDLRYVECVCGRAWTAHLP